MPSATVLITGASGFFGQNAIRWFSSNGYRVVASSRAPVAAVNGQVRWMQASPGPDWLNDITAVVHAAGRINGSARELEEANEDYTREVVEAVKKKDPSIPFVYISTVSAIHELGDYGLSKRRCEKIIETSGLTRWLILRPSLIFGPTDTKNVAALVRWVRSSPVVPVPGGKQVRLQPLYVDDLLSAVSGAIRGQGLTGKAYTVSGPAQVPLWEMISSIEQKLGRSVVKVPIPLELIRLPLSLADRLFPFFKLPAQQIRFLHNHSPWDSSEAMRDLGFAPRSFSDGLQAYLCAES